jgi:hypothetical protein
MMPEPICRNCLSPDVFISARGAIAPFFALRVFGVEPPETVGEAISRRIAGFRPGLQKRVAGGVLAALNAIPKAKKYLRYPSEMRTQIRVCRNCGFVGPHMAYAFNQLLGMYADYRSETYNRDRCRVEPSYVQVKDVVGKSRQEIEARLANVDTLLDQHVDVSGIRSVLDWGGGEGKFIPPKLADRSVTILDVSTESLANPAYRRVDQVPGNTKYDFLQLCHVLEHVTEPFALTKEALSHVNAGGIVYLEVPQDKTDAELGLLLNGSNRVKHVLHEHVNLYNARSLEMLGRALGLQAVHVSTKVFDFVWHTLPVVSGLFKKG